MSDIEQRLREANGRLKANNFGVSIEQIGTNLYLRATLPPKQLSTSNKNQQQRIKIALANSDGVKLAESEAKKLSIRIDDKSFSWDDYELPITQKTKTIGDWIAEFEKDYFDRRQENFKTATTWKIEYQTAFKTLPKDKILDAEILKQSILATKPDTRTRKRFCLVLGLLAKFANLNFNPSPYSGNYSPKSRTPRELPTDELIIQWHGKFNNSKWQWVYAMLATYGLRNQLVAGSIPSSPISFQTF